jgi:hypothetical protein
MKGEARLGDHLVICDRSGFKVWASECIREWNGLLVHRDHADRFRQPQDFVRGVKDDPSVRNPRPEATDTFLSSAVLSTDL